VDKLQITLEERNHQMTLSFRNKTDVAKAKLHGNNLGLWICDQLAQKLGFAFSTSEKDGYFEAQIIFEISAHNSPH
jgi:hypothetical protein